MIEENEAILKIVLPLCLVFSLSHHSFLPFGIHVTCLSLTDDDDYMRRRHFVYSNYFSKTQHFLFVMNHKECSLI